jgi:hypothetical protein
MVSTGNIMTNHHSNMTTVTSSPSAVLYSLDFAMAINKFQISVT